MDSLRHAAKSKFVRSMFLRVLSVFVIISIAIVAIVFYSFVSEINRGIISERRKQLAVIENTVSRRVEEITSIAYNIGNDRTFHLEPIADARYSGYEMARTLERYLVGNKFIEHLAYYRLSEPDTIYVSSGERSLSEFCEYSLGMDQAAADALIRDIASFRRAQVVPRAFGNEGKAYFAYVHPLPQFSENPRAFVLMLIPTAEFAPLVEAQLMNVEGELAIFDADGNDIYRARTPGESSPILINVSANSEEEIDFNGREYVVLRQVSESNGWTYASAIRLGDIRSGLTGRQTVFILLLLALMLAAVIALLRGIIVQYKPISNLAAAVTGASPGGRGAVDERALLSDKIATLQGDSAQKQKFETAYYAADAANKAKSAFLSSVSHDIRTPMHAIIGMTAIAYQHADEPAYVRDCLEKVQISSQYLLDIINNVLDMGKIESGRFSLSEGVIELPQLIDGLVVILQQSVEAKNLRLIVDAENIIHDRIIGDSVRLTQVFVNILSNAVKFTPEGGMVNLTAREEASAEPGAGDYVFTFIDTGIGMSDEFVARVFDTFTRADTAEASRTEGSGLGMAIAKNLVEMMGGTIKCESELGVGTTFIVKMRFKLAGDESSEDIIAQTAARVTSQKQRVPDLSGKRVLLVEDNAINREIAKIVISETNAEIVQAVNGKEAVDAFIARPEGYFSAILMDIQMPIMDGYAATATIRALERADARDVPIYAMTASTYDDDVRQVKEAGMNGHLGKPYLPEALYSMLEQAMATYSADK